MSAADFLDRLLYDVPAVAVATTGSSSSNGDAATAAGGGFHGDQAARDTTRRGHAGSVENSAA